MHILKFVIVLQTLEAQNPITLCIFDIDILYVGSVGKFWPRTEPVLILI